MVSDIDRLRSRLWYYQSKPDLLSKCKAEVISAELTYLRQVEREKKYHEKCMEFLRNHPEYGGILQ